MPDNLAFCNSCGANLQEEAPATEEVAMNEQPVAEEVVAEEAAAEEVVAEEAAAEEAVAEEVAAEEPVVEEAPSFAEPDFTASTGKPKRKTLAVLIPVLAVILATSIAVGAFFDPIKGFVVKTFSSPAAYFELVETKAINSLTDEILDAYDVALSNTQLQDTAVSGSLKFNISDGILSLLEEALYYEVGTNLDLSWLNEISLDVDMNVKNKVEQIFTKLNINGKELISADIIYDLAKNEFFMAVPLLNDSYLHMNSEALSYSGTDYSMANAYNTEILKALPSKKDAAALVNEYVGIIVGNIDDVKKSKETIEVGGIEQELTVLEATIDNKTVENIALDIMTSLIDNKTVKNTINKMADVMVEQGMLTQDDANEVYDSFVESINETIDDIKESGVDEDVVLTIIDYVNSNDEIVGRKLIVDGQEVLYYATATNSNEFGFELNFDIIEVVGNGTNKNGIVNGDYEIIYYGTKVCDICVSNCDTESDNLNGSFKFVPSSSIIKELFGYGDTSSTISLLSPAIEFNFKSNDKSGEFTMNLLSNDSVLFGITVTGTEKKATAIKTPNPSDCYSFEEIEQWASEMDIFAIYDRLAEVLPEDFTNSFLGLLM